MKFWRDCLYDLCQVSLTERLGNSYYWGADLDGELDTLWGLEGYTHPVGFFKGHVSSSIFKRETALLDSDKLLKHEQGLNSRDYDLKHYDLPSGWLTREDDVDKDSINRYVVAHHLFTKHGKRAEVIERLLKFSEATKAQASKCSSLELCGPRRNYRCQSSNAVGENKTKEAFKNTNLGNCILDSCLSLSYVALWWKKESFTDRKPSLGISIRKEQKLSNSNLNKLKPRLRSLKIFELLEVMISNYAPQQ